MLELKQKIMQLCVDSKLSIEAITFVLKDVYRDAEDALMVYKKQKEESESKMDVNINEANKGGTECGE